MARVKVKNNVVAMLGFGSQGKALAMNLRDSGYDVIIGLPSGSKSRRIARKEGFQQVTTTAKAVKVADIICVALPDHLQGRIYKKEIEPNLKAGVTLWFLHGFAVHFGFIKPSKESDLVLIAPHGPGLAVREKYLGDKSISAFYAVEQDFSQNAKRTVFELAEAVGFKKSRLVKTSFREEAIGDLFGEQAVLCGGMAELIMNGYKVLTENGLSSESAYLEVAYQLDLIIALIKQYGIAGMYERISVAARYGANRNGKKVIDKSVKQRMELVYKEIENGSFAEKLNSLSAEDIKRLSEQIKNNSIPGFERAANKYSK